MRWLQLLLLSAIASWCADIELGKKLFFDKRLSADSSVACATCHQPEHGFADQHALSPGVFGRKGERHTPSLIARAAGMLQFWDGRSASLEEQVVEPIKNPNEMAMSVDTVIERLRGDEAYRALTPDLLARALASYVKTIRSSDSPFDRHLRGSETLGPLEQKGFLLFRDKARCYICHSGDHFTDESFHNTGVAWKGGKLADRGRGAITNKPYHNGAFKTPTLREVARTAPYMHDGSIATLEEVIEFYDRGGADNPWRDPMIEPLHLSTEEKRALAAFLRALSGTVKDGE